MFNFYFFSIEYFGFAIQKGLAAQLVARVPPIYVQACGRIIIFTIFSRYTLLLCIRLHK